jgi:hypothetical protein
LEIAIAPPSLPLLNAYLTDTLYNEGLRQALLVASWKE